MFQLLIIRSLILQAYIVLNIIHRFGASKIIFILISSGNLIPDDTEFISVKVDKLIVCQVDLIQVIVPLRHRVSAIPFGSSTASESNFT